MAPISSASFVVSIMGVILVVLVNWLIPAALLCILQYFLSKMESPWPGRVLPILSGGLAVGIDAIVLSNMASIGVINNLNHPYVNVSRSSVMLLLVSALLVWLPMILYIVIYRRTRRNLVAKKNMEKMSIQDLE